MKQCLGILILFNALLLTSCSDNGDEWNAFGSHQSAIRGGEAANDVDYGAVVSIAVRSNDVFYSFCSGVLIAPDVVLTAAHCLKGDSALPFESFYQDGDIFVAFGERIRTGLETNVYAIDTYTVHPKFRENHHDLAVIRLKQANTDVEPMAVFTDKTRLNGFAHYEQAVEFVGYGVNDEDIDGKRLKTSGKIDGYCAGVNSNDCGKTLSSGKQIIVTGGALMHEIRENGPCHGDSGGPVLVRSNGVNSVVGIVSYGDSDCSAFSVSMSVPDHYDWIEDAVNGVSDEDGCTALPLKRHKPIQMCFIIFMALFVLGYKRMKKTGFPA